MLSQRLVALELLTLLLALALAAAPWRVAVDGATPRAAEAVAFADDGKGGGKGNGHGGGGSNGNGEGGSNGNDGKGGKDASKGDGEKGARVQTHFNRATGDRVVVRGKNIDVRHGNGMRETIRANRYVMKDARGRTIVNRPANLLDTLRLRNFFERSG